MGLVTPMTRLPKLIEPVDDLSDRSKVPRKQSRLLAFYENLKSAYKLHQKEDPESSTIRLKTCTFNVCWTKSDPAENEPLWGEISIENEKVDLMTVKDRKDGRLLRVHVHHCDLLFALQSGFHGPMQGQGVLARSTFLCRNPNGSMIISIFKYTNISKFK